MTEKLTSKEFKRVESKLSKATQEAYNKVLTAKYDEELSHAVTDEDLVVFKSRWTDIANQLAEGYILDIESI